MATMKRQKGTTIQENLASSSKKQLCVLVGTYRKDQLKKWILPQGLYNYPIHDADTAIKDAAPEVVELWLYAGKRDKLRFSASFAREVSADELSDLGYPRGKGKPHAEKYLLFRVEPIDEEASRGDAESAEKKPRAKSAKPTKSSVGADLRAAPQYLQLLEVSA